MEVIGTEIGHKMRSAIKAKLTEIGCYVDDELPDYVMVMVANKRTQSQMEEDLNLFLGNNTEHFVCWLYQVLKKLQEVSVPVVDKLKVKSESSAVKKRDKKDKDHKKDKKMSRSKTELTKHRKESTEELDCSKSKKKEKKHKIKEELKKAKKILKKKKEKRKSKHEKKKSKHDRKKSKETEIIRPNVPPLFMNMEKESEPSITDVFAGQILRSHGITIESREKLLSDSAKNDVKEKKKVPKQVIDPASVTSMTESSDVTKHVSQEAQALANELVNKPREEQIREMNEIETKIIGLKKKLANQLDTMSDDDDFINIRTEAEELMGDLADDLMPVLEARKRPVPVQENKKNTDEPRERKKSESPDDIVSSSTQEEQPELPQIELNLPRRSMRERLGLVLENNKSKDVDSGVNKSSLDSLPEQSISAEERLTPPIELIEDKLTEKSDFGWSKSDVAEVSSNVVEKKSKYGLTSVVRVRPRPRIAAQTRTSLLFKAVAEANKSLIQAPAKPDKDNEKVKRALVLPMRRGVDAKNIVIQVPRERAKSQDSNSDYELDIETESLDSEGKNSRTSNEQEPKLTTHKPIQSKQKYVPTLRFEIDNTSNNSDGISEDVLNIHAAASTNKEKGPTFVVTLDGLDPNVFLAKKLLKEGIIDDESELVTMVNPKKKSSQIEPAKEMHSTKDSETLEARRNIVVAKAESNCEGSKVERTKKRKASPIVFRTNKVAKSENVEVAPKTSTVPITSASRDDTFTPLLSTTDLRPGVNTDICRAFPLCKFGQNCIYKHPTCKFGSACTKRDCGYSHPALVGSISSHVVPSSNYKSIKSTALNSICKFYPNCVNAACLFYHPKPCRFGKNCINKQECNFYHHEVPAALKWKSATYKA